MNGILFILFSLIAFVPAALLLYNRHFRNYDPEILHYLKRRKLTFSKKYKPQRSDWRRSPFDKPPAVSLSMGQITVLGYKTSMQDSMYFVIETQEGRNFWLEIQTVFLFKLSMDFKEEPSPLPPRSPDELFNKEYYPCPACEYQVFDTEDTCPDCGLTLR